MGDAIGFVPTIITGALELSWDLSETIRLLLLEQDGHSRAWQHGVVSLTVLRPRRDALGILEHVAVHQIHEHHLHAVRGEETAGQDVRAVAKRHHVVRDGRHLGPGEIAGIAHAQEAVRVESGGVGAPDVRVLAD